MFVESANFHHGVYERRLIILVASMLRPDAIDTACVEVTHTCSQFPSLAVAMFGMTYPASTHGSNIGPPWPLVVCAVTMSKEPVLEENRFGAWHYVNHIHLLLEMDTCSIPPSGVVKRCHPGL